MLKKKQKKNKKLENNPSLCAARQLWKQKLKTGILFSPCRELLERTAIKFDAERAVLNQKLLSKQLVSLMTTLDSERSLTQLIVLYNFQDSVYVLADILPPFQLKDELDWWPRFSLIKSTAGCSWGKGKKKYIITRSYYSITRRRWWELMARVSWSPVVNGVQHGHTSQGQLCSKPITLTCNCRKSLTYNESGSYSVRFGKHNT